VGADPRLSQLVRRAEGHHYLSKRRPTQPGLGRHDALRFDPATRHANLFGHQDLCWRRRQSIPGHRRSRAGRTSNGGSRTAPFMMPEHNPLAASARTAMADPIRRQRADWCTSTTTSLPVTNMITVARGSSRMTMLSFPRRTRSILTTCRFKWLDIGTLCVGPTLLRLHHARLDCRQGWGSKLK